MTARPSHRATIFGFNKKEEAMSIILNTRVNPTSSWGTLCDPPQIDPLNYGFNRYAFDSSDPSFTNTRSGGGALKQ